MKKQILLCGVLAVALWAGGAMAATMDNAKANVYALTESGSGTGKILGTLLLRDTSYGLAIIPSLSHMPPGKHGFHVHENGSCGLAKKDNKMTAGMAAGGHLDPMHANKHLGPYKKGHLGDMPVLVVDAKGNATKTIIAPHLKLSEVFGHAIVIHQGGDNYSDNPPLGGGGARIACAVIENKPY